MRTYTSIDLDDETIGYGRRNRRRLVHDYDYESTQPPVLPSQEVDPVEEYEGNLKSRIQNIGSGSQVTYNTLPRSQSTPSIPDSQTSSSSEDSVGPPTTALQLEQVLSAIQSLSNTLKQTMTAQQVRNQKFAEQFSLLKTQLDSVRTLEKIASPGKAGNDSIGSSQASTSKPAQASASSKRKRRSGKRLAGTDLPAVAEETLRSSDALSKINSIVSQTQTAVTELLREDAQDQVGLMTSGSS